MLHPSSPEAGMSKLTSFLLQTCLNESPGLRDTVLVLLAVATCYLSICRHDAVIRLYWESIPSCCSRAIRARALHWDDKIALAISVDTCTNYGDGSGIESHNKTQRLFQPGDLFPLVRSLHGWGYDGRLFLKAKNSSRRVTFASSSRRPCSSRALNIFPCLKHIASFPF